MVKYYIIPNECFIRKIENNKSYLYNKYSKKQHKASLSVEYIQENGIEIPEHLALLWLYFL